METPTHYTLVNLWLKAKAEMSTEKHFLVVVIIPNLYPLCRDRVK